MDLFTKESSVLNLYTYNENLFDSCEQFAFEDIWSTSLFQMKFKIIKYYHSKNAKPDSDLINNQLSKKGYGKADILKSFGKPNQSIEKHIGEYMKDIFDAWCRRKLLPKLESSHSELSNESGDVDVNLDEIKSIIADIEAIKNNLSKEKSIHQIYDETLDEILDSVRNKNKVIGYSTGLTDLDHVCGGLKQEVIVIGSPPAAGKSSLMVNLIDSVAIKQEKPMMVFSLEMPARQLMKNMIANNNEINSYAIRGGSLLDEDLLKIKSYKNKLKDNLIIDETPAITWQYMESKIRLARKKIPMNQLMVVIVDYFQIMRNTPEETKGLSSEEQLSLRANGLLELSKKYNLCMIELSQITREVGKRDNKKPTMGDLKGSGAIEANAVIVILLYRPDYFEDNPMENGMSLKGLCEMNIAKNRYGETKRIYVRFKGKYSSFEDYKQDDNDIKQGEGDF